MATASARTTRLSKSLARSANLFSSLDSLLYSNVLSSLPSFIWRRDAPSSNSAAVRLDMGFRHHFHSSIPSQFKSYRSAIDEAAAKLKMEITSNPAELDKLEADLALFKQKQKEITELMTRIRSIKEQILYKRVVGQDIADESVADAIQRSEVTPVFWGKTCKEVRSEVTPLLGLFVPSTGEISKQKIQLPLMLDLSVPPKDIPPSNRLVIRKLDTNADPLVIKKQLILQVI